MNLLLQPFKGFYYGRDFNPYLSKFVSSQVKYATIPLIPQLVKGSEGRKLLDWMEQNDIKETFFESAEKVGSQHIIPLTDDKGLIRDDMLQK